MNAAQAISFVANWIQSRGLDYPTRGLHADPFEAGWSVYAPVEIDESDPMAFLDMPVGRSVFLVSHSGRIKEVPSSIPPHLAERQFIEEERTAPHTAAESDDSGYLAELKQRFMKRTSEGSPVIRSFTIVDAPAEDSDVDRIAAEASQLIDPIVQQLAQLGPFGWERFSAAFALTVSAEIAKLQFRFGGQSGVAPVPAQISELVRRQRHLAAQMPAGPWWRLLLTVTNRGEMTVDYDYGDEPFPQDHMMLPEHYRNDLHAYPRAHVPAWLSEYAFGSTA